MLNLEVGQKAKIVDNYGHFFADGEIVEFVEMECVIEDHYYVYVFRDSSGKQQLLEEGQFELL